jgi:hypothetical protein
MPAKGKARAKITATSTPAQMRAAFEAVFKREPFSRMWGLHFYRNHEGTAFTCQLRGYYGCGVSEDGPTEWQAAEALRQHIAKGWD